MRITFGFKAESRAWEQVVPAGSWLRDKSMREESRHP